MASTEENRRDYREMLFRTEGAEEFVSGVILFDETIRQNAADGTPLPGVLESKGIIPGIKVDKGAKQLAGSPDEKVTEGLDWLRDRLAEYRGPRRALREVAGGHRHRRTACPPTTASTPTPTRWRATPRCVSKPVSSRSSSPRC